MARKGYLLLFILAALAVIAGSHSATAAPAGSNITVRPFLQDIKIGQNDASEQFDLIITNDSAFRQVFHLSTVNFGSLNDTGGLVFEGANVKNLTSKYGLSKWIRLDKNDIFLDGGQQATVKVTILNDSSLSPGAHYAAIITTASKPVAKAGQLTITPKVSTLVFATKLGGEVYDIHLQSLSHNGNMFRLPDQANLSIKSTGNTYIVPRGVVTLKQGGVQKAKGIINSQSAYVLPQMTRDFNVPLVPTAGIKHGFVFTKYTLQADYRYDGVSQFATKSQNYTVVELKNVAALVGFIIIVGLLITKLRTKNGRADLNKFFKRVRRLFKS